MRVSKTTPRISRNPNLKMAIPRDPTSAEIARFLATRSGGQMVELMRLIQDPLAQDALTGHTLKVPSTPEPAVAPAGKSKKALNAFVGFRSYYISIPALKPFSMKMLSSPISTLWEADPNKPLWSLMSKAWSNIRDQIGKENTPLDAFFAIVCPFLNVPSPAEYLESNGWTVANKDGTPILSRNSHPNAASACTEMLDPALSVGDIMYYVQTMGYAQGFDYLVVETSSTLMAVSSSQRKSKPTPADIHIRTAIEMQSRQDAARKKRQARRAQMSIQGSSKIQKDILAGHELNGTPSVFPTPAPESVAPQHNCYDVLYNTLTDAFICTSTCLNNASSSTAIDQDDTMSASPKNHVWPMSSSLGEIEGSPATNTNFLFDSMTVNPTYTQNGMTVDDDTTSAVTTSDTCDKTPLLLDYPTASFEDTTVLEGAMITASPAEITTSDYHMEEMENPTTPFDFSHATMSPIADIAAFLPGADENATLPYFNVNQA